MAVTPQKESYRVYSTVKVSPEISRYVDICPHLQMGAKKQACSLVLRDISCFGVLDITIGTHF